MNFTVNKDQIVEAVSNVQRAISAKATMAVLEGILLTAHKDQLELFASDLELSMKTTIPAVVTAPGEIVLSARLFSDIVRKSPSNQINIAVDSQRIASIQSGFSQFSVAGMPPEEYPELPSLGDTATLSIQAGILKSMIRQTVFSVADTDSKPIHQGCLFHLQDQSLDVVAVDGYRLAKRTEPIPYAEKLEFVVPGKALQEILKLLKQEDAEIQMVVGARQITFQIENYTVSSSLLEGDFINYNATIPRTHSIEAVINVREAIDCVERVSLMISDRLKSPLRSTFSETGIQLLCTTSMGRANDHIQAVVTGGEVEIGFNNRYLLDALKNTECDEVRLQLNSALSPMLVLPKDGESFLFLVLPVRLKTE